MEIVYPPRNERDRLDQTPHRGDDYMDYILPLLEENAQLRGLVVTLSNIILKSVADQK
jgi:hypothetical protein